jgi:hypothetical protein
MTLKLRFTIGIDRSKMKLFDSESDMKMGRNRPLSNGSPKSGNEFVDQETGEIKRLAFKKPDVKNNRFKDIKV